MTGSEVVWTETADSSSTPENVIGGYTLVANSSGVISDTSYTVVFYDSGTYNVSVVFVNAAGYGVSSEPVIFTANPQG